MGSDFIDEICTLYPGTGKFLEKAVGVRVQNVVDYYFMGSPQEHWYPDDFVNCAPPWESFYLHWRLPRFSNSEGKMVEFSLSSGHSNVGDYVSVEAWVTGAMGNAPLILRKRSQTG